MSEPSPPEAADVVRVQLGRILGSQSLAGSDQLKRFLQAVVERTLNGQTELLKEYNLGLEVFNRPPDYDPKTDPIVRVQARRLRAKLEEYYAVEGANDSVVIQIPKGAYVPVFSAQKPSLKPAASNERIHGRIWAAAGLTVALAILAIAWTRRDSAVGAADIQRSVAVLPLKDFTEGGSRSRVADQIAEVLTTELAKNKELRVLSRTTASGYGNAKGSLPEIARALGVRWVVEGGVGVEGNRAYVKLRSVDAVTDRKIWADVLDCDVRDLVAVNARAAARIGAAIAAELNAPRR